MQELRSSGPGSARRRLVLGGALAIGLTLALGPQPDSVLAASRAPLVVAQSEAPRNPAAGQSPATDAPQPGTTPSATPPAIPSVPPVPGVTPPAPPAPDASADETDDDEDATTSRKGRVTVDNHGIVIQKGNKRVRVEGLGRDREYDSFEQFVQDAPWLAGLVFTTVLLVFLVPLLIIVLLIWYKIRKNRMANETMLKLAERGVVPPTAAMDAVASGNAASMAQAAASTPPGVPAYQHAQTLQRRAVWSDLRKGVALTGIGLGLSFFSMLDDGSPNSIGLVFLFVGLGYCLLWYFEDRPRGPRRDSSTTQPPGSA